MNKTIKVLVGLPGSGKTTFAKNELQKGRRTHVIDGDFIMKKKGKTFADVLQQVNIHLRGHEIVIIDGLILKTEWYQKIVEQYPDKKIEFHVWDVDREACLWNDLYRRSEDAWETIRRAHVDIPEVEELKKINPDVSIVKHVVFKKSGFEIFKGRFGLEGNELSSDSWTLYTESRGYDTDWERDSYSAEEEPESFDEFDELLLKVCPDIGFLQYKKLRKETTKKEDVYFSDYYSRGEGRKFVCDLRRLYELLEELGYININEWILMDSNKLR